MVFSKFTGKRILILGGGIFQIPLILKAKSLGLEVVVTDMYPDPPGRKVADFFAQVDIKNFEGNLKVAREYSVDAVTSDQTDVGICTVAKVCQEMGLKGIGYPTAQKFTNKHLMKEALIESGIPLPKYSLVASLGQARQVAKDLGYPLVLKPPSNQSSRGVHIVHDDDELQKYYPLTQIASFDGSVLIEEYIDGTEYTVEGFVHNNRTYSLAISDKKHLKNNPCVANRLTYPPEIDERLLERLERTNEKIITILGLPIGITHAEYKIRDGIPFLIEIAARGGGTFISSDIIPAVSGIDVNKLLLMQLFDMPFEIPYIESNAANLEFLRFDSGIVMDIQGVMRAKNIPGVKRLHLDFTVGDRLVEPSDDRSRHGFMLVTGKTRKEVLEVSEMVRSSIKIDIEENKR